MPEHHPEQMPEAPDVAHNDANWPNIPRGVMPNGARRLNFVHFHNAPLDEPMVAAVMITKNEDTSEYSAHVRVGTEFTGPDDDMVAMLAQHIDLRNL